MLLLVGATGRAQDAPPEQTWQQRPTNRRFAYVIETLHGPPTGNLEYEQFVTWKTRTKNDSGFDRVEFEHELEYGLSDRVYSAVSLAEWHVEGSAAEHATRYDLSAVELKFRIEDPRTGCVGLAVQTELGLGPAGLEWENTLIVDKIVDRWEAAWNLKVEAGWEGDQLLDFEHADGEIAEAAGVSYEIDPTMLVGAEFLHEIPLPDWNTGERQNLFLGPNLSLHRPVWALTLTPLFLLAGGDDEPRFQLRLLFEVDF